MTDVVRIFSTCGAFAEKLKGGHVITWGHPAYDGNSDHVHLLEKVDSIYCNENSFVAKLENNNLVGI